MNQALMPLTRRAQEYFEVLDQLRKDGYLTHEEWVVASNDEVKQHQRMTNTVIEDALAKCGYSRGSPNELKKYRMQWMDARGIEYTPLPQVMPTARPSLSVKYTDGAFENHLRKTAQQSENELKKATDQNDQLKAEAESLRTSLDEAHDKISKLFQESMSLQSELVKEKNNRFACESRLDASDNAFKQFKDETSIHFESLQNINESSLKYLQEENKRLKESYQLELKRAQEFNERENQLKQDLQSFRGINATQKDQLEKLQQALMQAHIKISQLERA
jgi:hypothetical protein